MKKLLFVFIISICLFFAGRVLAVEKIANFETTIKINNDATINVTETITYDFSDAFRHGIYRNIPVNYQRNGNNYNLEIDDITVNDEFGNPYLFTSTKSGKYLNIKIGDPDITVNGEKIYLINYQVKWAINYFSDHDELYWNVTGNEWPVSIENSSAEVILPSSFTSEQLQVACFAGADGSQESCSDFNLSPNNDSADRIVFSQKPLPADSGLTIVVGVPKGIIHQPAKTEYYQKTVKENSKFYFLLAWPILIFFFLFYRWWRHGRDLPGLGTIIPQYDIPDNLTPAEVGTVIDEKADNHDISADIINLAIKGYLKIEKLKDGSDYLLTKLKEADSSLMDFEKKLLDGIFGLEKDTKLSDLKYVFYKKLAEVKKLIYQNVVSKGYFIKNPQTVRTTYFTIGIGLGVLGFFLIGFFGVFFLINYFFLGFVPGLLFMIFSWLMPARTKKGTIAKENILGLKMYLTIAEKDRLKFHNAPEKNPQIFEKLLPYAMALKVEKQWAKQFEGSYTTAPNWYYDPFGGVFNAIIFVNVLNSFSYSANSVLAATPHSSAGGGGSGFGGGGFSGGGFGGGGGGSW